MCYILIYMPFIYWMVSVFKVVAYNCPISWLININTLPEYLFIFTMQKDISDDMFWLPLYLMISFAFHFTCRLFIAYWGCLDAYWRVTLPVIVELVHTRSCIWICIHSFTYPGQNFTCEAWGQGKTSDSFLKETGFSFRKREQHANCAAILLQVRHDCEELAGSSSPEDIQDYNLLQDLETEERGIRAKVLLQFVIHLPLFLFFSTF